MTISRTICLAFLIAIAVGTLLLMMPFSTSDGSWNSPLVALFTATSAVCVTGLAVVDIGTDYSFWGQLFILLLFQLGGLGYMTTTTFLLLLIGRRFDLRHKFAIQEAFDRPIQGSRKLIRSIFATTVIFELTGVFLLAPIFMADFGADRGLWLALFHSVSAWNNAGFSLFQDSLMSYQDSVAVTFIITTLIIFGGIGYQVILEMYMWGRDRIQGSQSKPVFSLNFKVVTSTTIVLLLLGTLAFFLTELHNPATLASLNFGDRLLSAWFQSVTTRTAGFNTIDISSMTTAALFITIAFMFVGASPSGTGGGIKTTTLRILLSSTKAILQGKDEVLLYQRELPVVAILKAISVLIGSVIVVVLGTVLISITDADLELIQILFEVVSAFATVGLSTGITASVSAAAKLVLVFLMYVGRVGVLLFMAAILGDPRPSVVNYPEENLLVG